MYCKKDALCDKLKHMFITWRGQSFFDIEIKNNQGEKITIVVDPFDEQAGLKVPRIEAQIFIATSGRNKNAKAIEGNPFLIDEPGEYELKGVFIKGIFEKQGDVIYKIEAEGIKICHLGALTQKELDENQVEEIGQVDILIIPVGGVPTINAKEAANIISQIEPKMIIPMYYKIPNLKIDLEGNEKFLKIMGKEDIVPQKKLKIAAKDLSKQESEIVVLEP